jgi:hypothetical protein
MGFRRFLTAVKQPQRRDAADGCETDRRRLFIG